MDTTNLIDIYNSPIIQDKLDTLLLSFTYFKGKCTDSDFTLQLSIPNNELQKHLRKLYSYRFLQKTENQKWACTQKSISILETFDFGNDVTELLLEELNIEARDKVFFMALINSCFKHDMNIPSTIYLRAIKLYLDLLDQSVKDNTNFLTKILYALLAGSNQALSNLGSQSFVSSILSWHSQRKTNTWHTYKDHFENSRNHWIHSCEKSHTVFRKSNEILFNNTIDYEIIYHAVLSCRLIIIIEDGLLDADFNHFCDTYGKSYSDVAKFLLVGKIESGKKNLITYFEDKIQQSKSYHLASHLRSRLSDTVYFNDLRNKIIHFQFNADVPATKKKSKKNNKKKKPKKK